MKSYIDCLPSCTEHEKTLTLSFILDCANSDHEKALQALIQGLRNHAQDHPGYLIHTSGTNILTFGDIERKLYGQISSKVYDDWEGVEEVLSLPDSAPHRKTDGLVIAAGTEEEPKIKTAIVCPPMIYGKGRGPGNQRGHPLYELSKCTLEKKMGVYVGDGNNCATNVHVYDLSNCYLKLVEAAVEGSDRSIWGKQAYYFTENGEHVWGDISKVVASAAHKQGFIPSEEVVAISPEQANELTHLGSLLWGANCRCKAIRARKLLGWSPKEQSMEAEIPDIIHSEAKRLGLLPGHAAQVAN